MTQIKIKRVEDLKPLSHLDPEGWGIDQGFVDVEKLRFDRLAYQREVSEPKAERIAREFDTHKFDAIRVNVRPDGTMWVVDGQNRVIAARKRFIRYVPAIFQHDETVKQEAEQFIATNTGRTTPTPLVLFKAALTAEHADELAVNKILEKTGWQIAKNSNTKSAPANAFSSPKTALLMYRRYGPEYLETALNVLRQVWPDDKTAKHAHLVHGLVRFLFKFGDVVKIGRLNDKLSSTTPTQIINSGKTLSTALPGSNAMDIADAIGQVLLSQYQKNRRGKRWDWQDRRIKLGRLPGDTVTRATREDVRPVKEERQPKPEVLVEEREPNGEVEAETPVSTPEVTTPEPTTVPDISDDDLQKLIDSATEPYKGKKKK